MLQANGITYEIETPDGPLKLLDNVSFNVPRGHFMAVVGPSGCGKTPLSLIHIFSGFLVHGDFPRFHGAESFPDEGNGVFRPFQDVHFFIVEQMCIRDSSSTWD